MLHAIANLLTENLWAALLIALFFGGSIFVHELGHFLAARLTGLQVDRFSIGFGPPIWSWTGKSGVEYRLSWFPLGGYVLLPQLADLAAIEGKATSDATKLPPAPYGAKMITFVAGAVFNVLFALALATIIWIAGQPMPRDNISTTIGYVGRTIDLADGKSVPSPAVEAGLRPGDTIRTIDGTRVRDWADVNTLIKLSSGRTSTGSPEIHLLIERGGQTVPVVVHPRLTGDEHYRQVGISPRLTPQLARVTPKSAADLAGFRKDDVIDSVDGVPAYSLPTIGDELQDHVGRPVKFGITRGSSRLTLQVVPVPGSGSIPAASKTGFAAFTTPIVTAHVSPFTQISDEVVMTVRTVASLINPHSDVGLSKMTGVIGIVQVYHEVAPEGLIPVMALTILINVNLAILNLLPVPVLDGGQMVFATIGWIRGRSLPMNFIVTTQSIFMMAIVVLMVYIGFFDVMRWRHG